MDVKKKKYVMKIHKAWSPFKSPNVNCWASSTTHELTFLSLVQPSVEKVGPQLTSDTLLAVEENWEYSEKPRRTYSCTFFAALMQSTPSCTTNKWYLIFSSSNRILMRRFCTEVRISCCVKSSYLNLLRFEIIFNLFCLNCLNSVNCEYWISLYNFKGIPGYRNKGIS